MGEKIEIIGTLEKLLEISKKIVLEKIGILIEIQEIIGKLSKDS